MKPTTLDAYKLLHDGILAFARAEQAGMRIDVEYCERKKLQLTRKIVHLEQNIKQSKFWYHWRHVYGDKANLDSNPQLSHILYKVRNIKPPKETSTGYGSTDEESLLQIELPEIVPLLEARKLKKIRDTYLDAFIREQVGGYIHPFFNLNSVQTYRSSCDRPNFQNIPKRDKESMNICRRAIFPRPGYQLLEVDYSGLEVRISACYHQDPSMIKYIMDKSTDMHRDMSREIFLIDKFDKKIAEHKYLRDAAKNGFVFPEFYGDYFKACAEYLAGQWCKLPKKGKWKPGQGIAMPSFGDIHISDWLIKAGICSLEDFIEHIRKVEDGFWNKQFLAYKEWKEKWWCAYQQNGYFDMLTGFRCSGVMKRNHVTNYPIQGSAFHCLLWSFVELDRIAQEEKWQSRLIGQIHDSIFMDIYPPELDHVLQTSQQVTTVELPKSWPWIIVPLEVEMDLCEVDQPWSEKKPYK